MCSARVAGCCHPGHPVPGSGRPLEGGAWVACRSSHAGMVAQPAARKWSAAALAARREGARAAGPALSSATQRSAASGRRAAMTGRASAHAAQYAAGAMRTAEVRPTPPIVPGNCPIARASATWSSAAVGLPSASPSSAHRVFHTAASCCSAYAADWSGGTVRKICCARGAQQYSRSSHADCRSGRRCN